MAAHTHGRVRNLFKTPFDTAIKVLLLNSIYFKGSWRDAFAVNATSPDTFYSAAGASRIRPFMHRTGFVPHYRDSTFEAIDLPYAGDRLVATIILPAPGQSPESLLPGLGVRWNQWRDSLASQRIAIALPRFRSEGQFDLRVPLRRLGIQAVFDELQAPLTLIEGPESLFVGRADQATFLEVTEVGTEAAAVTGASMLVPRDEVTRRVLPFVVNRPFLFALHDTGTGLLLFLGRISQP